MELKVLALLIAFLTCVSARIGEGAVGSEVEEQAPQEQRELANNRRRVFHFLSNLNSGQETTTCASPAFGNAYVTLTGRELCVFVSFTPFSSAWTAAHLHGPAGPRQDAGVLIDFQDSVVAYSSFFDSCKEITWKERRALLKGHTYFNMHSEECPAGEIRGQILPVFDGPVQNNMDY